jgi:crossover junction endodeoxyribonuclease RusA
MICTITLPWPSPELSPNARLHWSAMARAKKSARRTAYILTMEAKARQMQEMPRLLVAVTYNPPSRQKYDMDNLVSRMKSAFDGISDACFVDDGKWDFAAPVMGDPVKGGAVTVVLQGVMV